MAGKLLKETEDMQVNKIKKVNKSNKKSIDNDEKDIYKIDFDQDDLDLKGEESTNIEVVEADKDKPKKTRTSKTAKAKTKTSKKSKDSSNKNIIKVETGVSANIKKIVRIILIIFMIGIVMLTSGLFKYKTIVIASGSMEPIIYRGDISIIRKLSDSEKERLTEGEIIVFKMDGKTVIHRINGIIKSGNDIFYRTKGDNNDTVDNYLIEKQDIIAVSKCIIKYIGYPSLWLSEMW